ncbi:MAG: SH3 domain-containing protein [Clostridiaceae bacterium]|nr:SH3 domain-containing protein [Clostridiaceae bacterium]
MVKQRNVVIRKFIWLLLIAIVFTILFTVNIKAETLDNIETIETIETMESTEKIENEDLTESQETVTEEEQEVTPTEVTATEEAAVEEQGTSTEYTTIEESEVGKSIEEAVSEKQGSVTEESTADVLNDSAQSGEDTVLPTSYSRSTPSQVTRYIYANSIIRSTPNGSVITTLKMPLFVTGIIEGAWLKFTYNGSTAYVAMSVTTTDNPAITGYAKSAVNVRDTPGGSVIGSLSTGYKVSGILVGNWVKFIYSGKTGYLYVSLLQATPIQVTRYIFANSNLRGAPNGSLITTLEMPLFVSGTIEGAWLKFTYNGKTAYVAMSMTSTNNPAITCYAKSVVNVRNAPSGSVIGSLTKGHKITGYCEGAWIRITYNGQTAYIAAKYTDIKPVQVTLYIRSRILAVRPDKNSKELLGVLNRGTKVTGYREGVWIRIIYNDQTGYIAAKFTTEEVVNPKTGIQKLDKVLDEARKWIGTNERNMGHKYIIDTYNKQPNLPRGYPMSYKDPWCAAFVSFIGIQTKTTDILGREVSVYYHMKFFMKKGQWIEDGTITPRPGDLVAFSWNATKQPNNDFPNHIGFVESIDNGYFYTIEGNASLVNNTSPEDLGIDYVERKRYEIGSRVIRGFARPNYK